MNRGGTSGQSSQGAQTQEHGSMSKQGQRAEDTPQLKCRGADGQFGLVDAVSGNIREAWSDWWHRERCC